MRKILHVSLTAKKGNEWILNKAGVKRELSDTAKAKQLAYYGRTVDDKDRRELSGEKDNARNNARCTQARKTTHCLDRQHQDVDRTPCGRINQNDRGQKLMENVHLWCGQPLDQGWLKNRSELLCLCSSQ